ncbi:Transcriptional regulator FimZ [Escherichia coli]
MPANVLLLGATGLIGSHLLAMLQSDPRIERIGNDSNLLIVFYVQIMPDGFVMQLHRF